MSNTDTSENVEIQGNITVISNIPYGNGDVKIQGGLFTDTISSNTNNSIISIQNSSKIDGFLELEKIAMPSVPSTSYNRLYQDSSDGLFKSINSSGVISTINPLTAKGDLLVHDGNTESRLPIGANGQLLVVDSSFPKGVKWVTGDINPSNYSILNIGTTGTGLFKQQIGNVFEFKKVDAGSTKISIFDDIVNNKLDIDIQESNIIHQNISGAGINTHTQIDSHISSTSNPHSVTLQQITPTTTKGDLMVQNSSTVVRHPIGPDSSILVADSTLVRGIKWIPNSHNILDDLLIDDHTQYLLLDGRSGGQIAIGGTDPGDSLILRSSSNITKGQVIIDETTSSSSNTTGALIVNGGVGIAENMYIGGQIRVDSILENTTSSGVNIEGVKLENTAITLSAIFPPVFSPPPLFNFTYYQDVIDSLFKSMDSSGNITTYQPTNTKGDLVTHDGTTQIRLPVGLEDQVLIVDPSQPSGIKWQNISSGSGGTGTDINSNKYCNLYSSGTQLVTSSYQDMLFDSDRRIDDFYTHSLLEQNIITINSPGRFFIYFRCSMYIEDGSNIANGNVRMVLDEGSGFNEVPGSLAYMYNRNDDDRGHNTTCFSLIKDLNADDILKLQFRNTLGSSQIQTLQNGTELIIIRIKVDQTLDSSQYLSVYKDNSQVMFSSYTDVIFNISRIVDTAYSYSNSTGVITLTESGVYTISCNISTQNGINSVSQGTFIILADTGSGYNYIPGSTGYTYNRSETIDTGFVSFIYNGSPGDLLKVQCKMEGGSSKTISLNGCNLNIMKLKSSLGQNSVKYFDGYNEVGGTVISNNYIDIPIISENIKDAEYTHSVNSPEITVVEDGRYLILARICYYKTSSNVDSVIKSRLVSNNGTGYFEISGTESFSYHDNEASGSNQAFIGATIQLAANSQIKLQGVLFSGDVNVSVEPFGTGITIMRLEKLDIGQGGLIIFGSELNYVESTSNTTTNSLTYVQKLRLTTDNIPSGVYRIGFYYKWSLDDKDKQFSSRIQIDDVYNIHETTETVNRDNQEVTTSGMAHVSLSLGVHTIDLDFKVDSIGVNASIKDSRIEIWRIS